MHKSKILIVDDDASLQIVTGQYLEDNGFDIVQAYSVKEAIQKIDIGAINVILLDLTLPDGEGLPLITQFQQKSDAAILVVSGKDDTTEKIICLEMGADDYLTKPFEMRELTARIKAVQRRVKHLPDKSEEGHSGKLQLENWYLDSGQFQIFSNDNKSLDFTTGEFQLFHALIKSANRALSREQLFEHTGRDGHYDSYDRAIDIQIGRIRKKLGDENGQYIKTIRGIGYMYAGRADPI